MKRFVFTILSALYLVTASGATVQLHYCMGELESWSLGQKEQKVCGKCGMEKNRVEHDDCCKDEYKQMKLNIDQRMNLTSTTCVTFFEIILSSPFPFEYVQKLQGQNQPASYHSNSPPQSCIIPVYLRNENFRL